MDAPVPRMRIDKWLWHARFFKTRTLAAATVSAGHVRINSVKASKPAHGVVAGDVLSGAPDSEGGRPTKRDRRIFDLDRRRMLE